MTTAQLDHLLSSVAQVYRARPGRWRISQLPFSPTAVVLIPARLISWSLMPLTTPSPPEPVRYLQPVEPALFEIRDLHVSVQGTEILRGVDLVVPAGQLHALMGPNGGGKSTLAKSLLGSPGYEVTAGKILYKGEDITDWPTETRGKAGIFLAFQYPEEIRGRPARPIPAPGAFCSQGSGALCPGVTCVCHGVDAQTGNGRVLRGPLPQRGLLRRGEEAQRGPPDGSAPTRPGGPG